MFSTFPVGWLPFGTAVKHKFRNRLNIQRF